MLGVFLIGCLVVRWFPGCHDINLEGGRSRAGHAGLLDRGQQHFVAMSRVIDLVGRVG